MIAESWSMMPVHIVGLSAIAVCALPLVADWWCVFHVYRDSFSDMAK